MFTRIVATALQRPKTSPGRGSTAKLLSHGTLPGILSERSSEDREKTLSTYAAVYLREEVQAESLSRSLEGFARF